jgi:hypothetical protein
MHMQTSTSPSPPDALAAPAASLDSSEEDFELHASRRYCPTDLLSGFAWLMAGHGRCVSTAMMLGDREYAMWQLGCARALGDNQLDALARRLFAYFDEPRTER